MQALVDEINGAKGRNDAEAVEQDWWRMIDWKTPEYITLFDSLGEETRVTITEAGLCPTCEDQEECPEGEEKNEEGECVPMKKESEDVLESNPGFTKPAPAAEAECPEGEEWNEEKDMCVPIAGFSDLPEAKSADKLDPRKVLEDSDKLL